MRLSKSIVSTPMIATPTKRAETSLSSRAMSIKASQPVIFRSNSYINLPTNM